MKRKSSPDKIKRIALAVDLVILTIHNSDLSVLLIQRGIDPYLGQWALPGGFVREGEDLDAAARRELAEEAGLDTTLVGHIEQLATFGAPARDPRERVVSIAYLAFLPNLPLPVAGGDARGVAIVPVSELIDAGGRSLAFDHAEILSMGVERCRAKLEYTPLATNFLGDEFTINELRTVYESVWGIPLDPGNFHRKVTKTAGFLRATQSKTHGQSGRPAQLFTKGDAHVLQPALLRSAARS
jgi:8-oxo-dGTP diphosphatase